jgi:hypothetical protein
LGGGAGAHGGSSYRPIDGQLTQRHVCYDTSEEASPCLPSGFSSLVDNLRRIRYWQEPATWFGVITSGAPPSGSYLNVYIKPGLWYPSTTEYCAFAGGNSPTFTLPGVLDRIDTVYIDPSGVLHIQRGTPAVSPTITLPPIASGIPLWAVHLTPTASGITFIECSGYYSGMGYIERDLRPFLNLGGGGIAASGVLPAATAEGQALVSSTTLEWVADTTPLWKGEHSFEAGIAFIGATTENSVTIPDAQTQAFHIIDTGGTEFLRINTYDEDFIIDPANAGINVGIGVNPPDQDLHVHGSLSVTIKLTTNDTGIAGHVGFDIGVATDESVYMWNRENTELTIGTNNTCRITILAGGNVGIATGTPEGQLDVAYSGGAGNMTLLLGANVGYTTRYTYTNKMAIVAAYHYINTQEPVGVLHINSTSSVSSLDIGGGTVYCNAATEVAIWTAADTTTTTGTKRFSVSSTGTIIVTGPSLEVPDEWWVGIGAAAERIIFDSAGDISFMGCNVGVGVITPNQQLTVEGTIDLKEQAAANADVASYGQIWVKNTAPNELWFTDDAGTDVQLGLGGGGLPAVAGAGYALVSDGVDSWAADQTPAWTGKHSFGAGVAFTGASGTNVISAPDNMAQALQIYDVGDK